MSDVDEWCRWVMSMSDVDEWCWWVMSMSDENEWKIIHLKAFHAFILTEFIIIIISLSFHYHFIIVLLSFHYHFIIISYHFISYDIISYYIISWFMFEKKLTTPKKFLKKFDPPWFSPPRPLNCDHSLTLTQHISNSWLKIIYTLH